MSMDALSRGMRTDLFDVRELELKNATKGALVAAELAKAYDARRDRGKQTVNVGQADVEAGGRAVVGNVNSGTPGSSSSDGHRQDTEGGAPGRSARGAAAPHLKT